MLDQAAHQAKRQEVIRAKNSRRPCPGAQEFCSTLLTLPGALSMGNDINNGAFRVKASRFSKLVARRAAGLPPGGY